MTQQPAGENERQMEVMRRRVHVERHQHDENGVTRGDASTSRGEREGGVKASSTQERLNIQCAEVTGERAWSLDDRLGLIEPTEVVGLDSGTSLVTCLLGLK